MKIGKFLIQKLYQDYIVDEYDKNIDLNYIQTILSNYIKNLIIKITKN